ncbi:hypothetical protein MBLL_00377 (plasmid) [Methylobacterium bullatum]|uniref:Uncharacterized protein n=1 Tax=Methylobacterium bullatum TaxID=570505 RepID=A0A679JXX5_9HYPH|nr:hypothetical protein MBLL_00377 [Methylobacterium bullatum]
MVSWGWFVAHVTAPNVGAIAGILSAVAWFWSACISAKDGITWLSGPPTEVWRAMRLRSLLNAAAAFLSAVAAGCTSWALWNT